MAVTECVSVSTFSSLVGIPIGITSSPVKIKICTVTAGIENCNSIIKKKKKKRDKIILLTKTKLNIVEVLICKVLIDSYISLNELVWVNILLREYIERRWKESLWH